MKRKTLILLSLLLAVTILISLLLYINQNPYAHYSDKMLLREVSSYDSIQLLGLSSASATYSVAGVYELSAEIPPLRELLSRPTAVSSMNKHLPALYEEFSKSSDYRISGFAFPYQRMFEIFCTKTGSSKSSTDQLSINGLCVNEIFMQACANANMDSVAELMAVSSDCPPLFDLLSSPSALPSIREFVPELIEKYEAADNTKAVAALNRLLDIFSEESTK